MKTFYVSCSSQQRDLARRVAGALENLGLVWASQWNWADRFDALHEDRERWPQAAALDVACAVGCDLFVFLVTREPTFGGGCEFGARYQVGKESHVVFVEEAEHPFYLLPNVRLWHNLDAFYRHAQKTVLA